MFRTLVLALIICCPISVFAQDDDTIQFHHGLPEEQEDTVSKIQQQDFKPTDNFVEISAEQVPQELYKTLNREKLFKGWEHQVLQLDKNTGTYWLQIKDNARVRSYGLTAEGKIISVREKEDRD